jgi:hypothetical protein
MLTRCFFSSVYREVVTWYCHKERDGFLTFPAELRFLPEKRGKLGPDLEALKPRSFLCRKGGVVVFSAAATQAGSMAAVAERAQATTEAAQAAQRCASESEGGKLHLAVPSSVLAGTLTAL